MVNMKVDGAGWKPKVESETNKPKPVVQPQIQPPQLQYKNSVAKENLPAERQLAYRLNSQIVNAQFTDPAGPTTPAGTTTPAAPVADPYANQTADQIAAEQRANYENAENQQQAAEETGRVVADIARYDPAKAFEVTNQMLADGVLRDEDTDEFAQEAARALIDNGDLRQVASSREGQALLRQIETNLLDYPVHGDEAAHANQIRTALDEHGIFLGAPNGMYPEGVDPARIIDDPNATPEQVAAYIKLDPDTAHNDFIEALDAHKDDADWLAGFYSALGSETAGQLIEETVDPLTHNTSNGVGTDPEFGVRQAELVRHSLETLQEAGKLTQDGINALVGSMRENPYIATEIFGKSSNNELKEMFVNAAINDGSDFWDAGALHVLNTMPAAAQEEILQSLTTVDTNGIVDDSKLKAFIEGAMIWQKDIPTYEDAIRYGIYAESDMVADQVNKMTYGGVESLLGLTTDRAVQYYPYNVPSPFSEDLQNRIFGAVVNGLNNQAAFDNFKDDPGFKDALSEVFIQNGQDILHAQAPDGAFQDEDFITGMTKFFELTLFSANGGEKRDELMESVIRTMGDVGDASKAPPLSQSDYEQLHGGWSQQDHVEVMGGMMGMVWQAAENQKDYIQNEIMQDEARKKEMIGFFAGMAFSFLPGASDVIGKIAGEGASFLEQIPDKLVDFAWDQTKDQLKDESQDFLLGLLKGMTNADALTSIDALTNRFSQVIVATNAALPNGEEGELNLRTAFQSAFAFYGDLVEFT